MKQKMIMCPNCGKSYRLKISLKRLLGGSPSDATCPFCENKVLCPKCGFTYDKRQYNACPRCEWRNNRFTCLKCCRFLEKSFKDSQSELCSDCAYLEKQIFCEKCGSLYDITKYTACPYCTYPYRNRAKKPDIIKRDENGILYADFDLRILRLPDLRQCGCGHFMNKDTKYCAACGSLFIDFTIKFTDPIEYTQDYRQVQEEIKKQLEAEFPPEGAPYLGKVHDIWHRKQRILLEQYYIRWRTPAEMNPHICID